MRLNQHFSKFDRSSSLRVRNEQLRLYKNKDGYKNYVDHFKTENNEYVELTPNGFNWKERIDEALATYKDIVGKKPRANFITTVSVVESVPESWSDDVAKEYFNAKCEWFENYMYEHGLKEESFLSMSIHLDETTPHATMVFLPIDKDGKLNCKNIVNKNFLFAYQRDGQEWSFNYIDNYNREHPERQIEKLEPILSEKRKHLNEQEYKEMKIEEHVKELESKHEELTDKIEKANVELKSKKEEAKTLLENERQDLIAAKDNLIDVKKDYETKVETLGELLENPQQVKRVVELAEENKSLKEELTLKDKIIQGLKEETQKLTNTINDFKSKLSRLGEKLMKSIGFEPQEEVNKFPDKEVSKVISELQEQSKQYNPKDMRVIQNEDESFKVVVKEGNDYKTLEDNFKTRQEAEDYRRGFDQTRRELVNKNIDDSIKLK